MEVWCTTGPHYWLLHPKRKYREEFAHFLLRRKGQPGRRAGLALLLCRHRGILVACWTTRNSQPAATSLASGEGFGDAGAVTKGVGQSCQLTWQSFPSGCVQLGGPPLLRLTPRTECGRDPGGRSPVSSWCARCGGGNPSPHNHVRPPGWSARCRCSHPGPLHDQIALLSH